jgi:hypothetical protein
MIHEDFKYAGWIKLHRKMMRWEWFNDSHMVHIFIYFLLKANRTEGRWKGLKIQTGQLAIGLRSLSKKTGMTYATVRYCLKRMVESHEITIEGTHLCSIITICNYKYYNFLDHKEDTKKPKNGAHLKTQSKTHSTAQSKNPKKPTTKVIEDIGDSKRTHIEAQSMTLNEAPNKNINTISKNKKNKKSPENEFREDDKKSDFIQRIIDQFCVSYQAEHGFEYEVLNPAKERAAAAKILQVYKKQHPDSDTHTTLSDLGHYFSACVAIKDRWLGDNMCLPIINSKFNQIKNILLNGKDRSNSAKNGSSGKDAGATDREIAEIIARKFAVEK